MLDELIRQCDSIKQKEMKLKSQEVDLENKLADATKTVNEYQSRIAACSEKILSLGEKKKMCVARSLKYNEKH